MNHASRTLGSFSYEFGESQKAAMSGSLVEGRWQPVFPKAPKALQNATLQTQSPSYAPSLRQVGRVRCGCREDVRCVRCAEQQRCGSQRFGCGGDVGGGHRSVEAGAVPRSL